jgi:sialic acid synthase SpsE
MCGMSSNSRRIVDERESLYLNELRRGAYLNRDIVAGEKITLTDLYFAIPLQPGQVPIEQLILDSPLLRNKQKHSPLLFQDIL